MCDDVGKVEAMAGQPLTIEEIKQAGQVLARWHAPDAFKSVTEAFCSRCVSKDWFNKPQLKFLHDAFVLACFAQNQGVAAVRLAEPLEQWPDGYVRM
jgi:hypothetical protein